MLCFGMHNANAIFAKAPGYASGFACPCIANGNDCLVCKGPMGKVWQVFSHLVILVLDLRSQNVWRTQPQTCLI